MNSIISEVTLKYSNPTPVDQLESITSPQQAAKVFRSIWSRDLIQLKEEFMILLLSNSKKCLGYSKISTGGATATIVDPAAIFQVALLANAQSIILGHNHPSGNLSESRADVQLTKRIVESGKMLGIAVDDHLILTAEGYLSFKEKGLMN